jgi:alpha-L-rhamnosidase
MSADVARRRFTRALLASSLAVAVGKVAAQGAVRKTVTEFGAVADGKTVNTGAIQSSIDQLAAQGGGTVVVPAGRFVSGALFLKPQVHLHFEPGAVLECSTDMHDFPGRRTRIEGHFEDNFTPALINAKGCHGLRITGEGTLDGAGRPIWDQFWKLRNAAPDPHNFPNLGLPRARLALLEESRDVLVEGLTFKDAQFWNLHI